MTNNQETFEFFNRLLMMISPIEMFAAFSTVFSKHQYGPQCSTKQRERHDLAFEGHSIVSKHFAY